MPRKHNGRILGSIFTCARCGEATSLTRPGEKVCPKCSPDYRIEQERKRRRDKRTSVGGRTLGDIFTCRQCGEPAELIQSKQKRCLECMRRKNEQRRVLGSIFACAGCGEPTVLTLGKQKMCKTCAYEEKKRKDRESYQLEIPVAGRRSVGLPFKCIICDNVVVRESHLQKCCSENCQEVRNRDMYRVSRVRWVNSRYEIKPLYRWREGA
jgi:hypothetical protein